MSGFSVGNVVRRRWTAIVTVIVVAVVGFSTYRLHGIFGSNNIVSRPPWPPSTTSTKTPNPSASTICHCRGRAP